MERLSGQRVVWIDIYKAICIILVVVGHATGQFNGYIYQFHMAAFFFISGYTSKIWKKDLEKIAVNKIKTILIPMFTMIIGIALLRALKAVVFSEITALQGIKYVEECIRDYLIYGNSDQMLGAMWFLPVLVFIFIIQRIAWRALGDRGIFSFAILTVVVYLLGYYLQSNGYRQSHCFDMALIGQLFFGVGVIASRSGILELLRKNKWRYLLYIAAVFWLYFMRRLGGTVVDYPSRNYPNVFMTAVAPMGGIMLVFGVSNFVERLGTGIICLFSRIGRDTMGVLFFHFIGFKVATILLLPTGVTTRQDVHTFLLPESVTPYGWSWIFYTVVSLAFCIGTWELLNRVPGLGTLLSGRIKPNTEESDFTKPVTECESRHIISKQAPHITEKQFKNSYSLIDVKNRDRQREIILILLVTFSVLIIAPLLSQRIMCNDELQAHLSRMCGIRHFIENVWNTNIRNGRVLGALILPFTMISDFLFKDALASRIVTVGTILVVLGMFSFLIHRWFHNRALTLATFLVLISALPVTFEHTVPNAFNGLFNIPIIILLISLIVYTEYVDKGKRCLRTVSMLLFFVACMAYEVIVTYLPLFAILFLLRRRPKELRVLVKNFAYLAATGLIYLGCYFGLQCIFPSQYEGNQIGGFTFASSTQVLFQLWKSSLPGYWLTNKRYGYIYQIYMNLVAIDYLRIFVVCVLFAVLAFMVVNACWKQKEGISLRQSAIIISCGLLYSVLPATPLAISSMYQSGVNATGGMAALPVTFFLYLSSCFIVAYTLCIVFQRMHRGILKLLPAAIIVVLCIGVCDIQQMNTSFAKEQYKNFERIEMIEDFLGTQFVTSTQFFEKASAPDLFECKNALAIHDTYWNEYLNTSGSDTKINSDMNSQTKIFMENDAYFIITDGDYYVVALNENLSGQSIPIDCHNGFAAIATLTESKQDGNWYFFSFRYDALKLSSVSMEEVVFVT